MLIEVKLLSVQGQAAIVTFRDGEGIFQGRIISINEVADIRTGETKLVSDKILSTGTEYGIDWETLLGEDYVLTPADIGQELRRHGLWTYEDLNSNPNVVTAALNSLAYRVFAELMRAARDIK